MSKAKEETPVSVGGARLNPFADLAERFAPTRKPETYRFELYGLPCLVRLQPMRGGEALRFFARLRPPTVNTQINTVETTTAGALDPLEGTLEMVQKTVCDYELPIERRDESGQTVYDADGVPERVLVKARERDEEEQRADLEEQPTEVLNVLINLCWEVNSTDPNDSVGPPLSGSS